MIAVHRPVEKLGQVLPIPDADFGQGASLAASSLDPVAPVAMLFGIGCIVGTQPRARACTKILLGELAFDGDALLRSTKQHVDTRRSRFSQATHLVLEIQRPATVVFEEGWPAAFGGYISEQIKAVEGADRPEHALRQGLGTLQAAEPPMPLVWWNGGTDVMCFRPVRRNQDTLWGEFSCKNRRTPFTAVRARHSTAKPSFSSTSRASLKNSGSQCPADLRVESPSSNQPRHHAFGARICTIGDSPTISTLKRRAASAAIAPQLASTMAA